MTPGSGPFRVRYADGGRLNIMQGESRLMTTGNDDMATDVEAACNAAYAAGQAAERAKLAAVVEAAKIMHEFLYDNELCNEPCGPEADCNLRAALKALDAGSKP